MSTGQNAGSIPELSEIRKAIDGIDGALITLFAKRFAEVNKVVKVKQKHDLPAAIPARIEEIVLKIRADATKQGFPPDVAEKIWRLLINEMIIFEESHLT
ncbi:MAG: chorismate mutase [Aestuariivirga sp.]